MWSRNMCGHARNGRKRGDRAAIGGDKGLWRRSGLGAVLVFALLLQLFMGGAGGLAVYANPAGEEGAESAVAITAAAAVLMEGATGAVLYEKNATEQLRPASITKVMTLLLIFEALEEGRISLTDTVSVSEHAASMGGSQVFLEPNETQTVDVMIKCISIASANDASVAMAEHLAGSEEAFVQQMNARAKELSMNHTNFVNCYGLDTDNHYTCALDVALMSRELIMNHPEISNYATVWMDTITHTTAKGKSEFGLTNTNKLIKSYQGITGLKTGSTGLAKYCLSATANRDGMNLIAVVLAAPDTKTRFAEAAKLLNYGFANSALYNDNGAGLSLAPIPVKGGVAETVEPLISGSFSYVCLNGMKPSDITREAVLEEVLTAPVEKGAELGHLRYLYQGEELGTLPILAAEAVEKATIWDCMEQVLGLYF